MSHLFIFLLLICSFFLAPNIAIAATKQRYGYYSETCPEAESIVRSVIHRAMIREPRSAASIMRLQFHDCFVNGCDGSVLLDDTSTMLGEKLALSMPHGPGTVPAQPIHVPGTASGCMARMPVGPDTSPARNRGTPGTCPTKLTWHEAR